MPRRLIENEEQRIKRWRAVVASQLENARRQVSLAKRFLDAPQEDPFWELWTDDQRGRLGALQYDCSRLQQEIRKLTLEFHDGVPRN